MIKQKITAEIPLALKANDKTRLDALRFILSLINYAEIEKPFNSANGKNNELTDDEIITLLQKEVKKRQEGVEMFKKAGRADQVKKEESQITIIKSFLPAQMNEEELNTIVDETLKSIGPNPQMGQVIGQVMSKVKGKADGSAVASLVRKKLTPKS